jgi:hypothetical protein
MTTPLDAFIAIVRAASDYDPRGEVAPEAVLWCDVSGDFRPLLPALRRALPNLLTLGDYDPARRQGPAIWLRAALGRAVAGVSWEGDAPAILYLPGVARETLRAAEDCPKPLQLLAWYVVGGAVFGHPNAKDWTLRGFLAAKSAYGGLGLDVPQDEPTRQALAAAAPKLFDMPIVELAGRRLDAPWLNALLAPDLVEDTLAWVGGSLTRETDSTRFAAFQARAKAELKLDPGRVKPATAAARLLRRETGWDRVWNRFAAGGREFHEDVAAVLAPLEPPDLLATDPTIYATANARQEAELRTALAKLEGAAEPAARDAVSRLARHHERRCSGPWAARGQSRLAFAVQHLAYLAGTPPLPAQDAATFAEAYAAAGWQADDAALRALEAVAPRSESTAIERLGEDRAAVVAALRAIYAPWLQRNAEVLQHLLRNGVPRSDTPADGDAVLFVDGLRMDLAQRLAVLLRDAGARVEVGWRWTGYPTVTATCKPLASPAADRFQGADAADTFEPQSADGRRVVQAVLLRELAALGWRNEVTLVPSDRCWIEAGHFDTDGHGQQSRMADHVSADLSAVAAEAWRLVRAGRRLRIATDHGWLMLPGGLPVASLPSGLTETRWLRCAVVKEGAASSATQLPWTWNPGVHIATAPGIHVFRQGAEYAHGGISPQECIVPELLVVSGATARRVKIEGVEWDGMRVRVRAGGSDGLSADLRLGADGDEGSIVDRPRQLDADGRTSLLVPDDMLIGRPALLELRDAGGQVVASRATVVGG